MPHVCPWWLTYTFDNPLRKFVQDPYQILSPHIRLGMRVADVGCGMGYFSITMAKLVGDSGYVQAIDLQAQQLKRVEKRAIKSGVAARVDRTLVTQDSLNLKPPMDFVLAFAVVHEVPSAEKFFKEIFDSLKPGGRVLVAEPSHHVNQELFARELETAGRCGLAAIPNSQRIRLSRVALLENCDEADKEVKS
jgi:2-polyprenyl-3-methyl-5-hydroxy-6-metoxy-1,4-benzoquinol methylase